MHDTEQTREERELDAKAIAAAARVGLRAIKCSDLFVGSDCEALGDHGGFRLVLASGGGGFVEGPCYDLSAEEVLWYCHTRMYSDQEG